MSDLGERRPVRYVLVPKDGIDVLHRDPGESCQLDDTEREQTVTPAKAVEMSMNGHARLCGYCWPTEEPTE